MNSIKIKDGAQDAQAFEGRMSSFLVKINSFKRKYDNELSEAGLSLDLDSLKELQKTSFKSLDPSIASFLEDASAVFKAHYREHFGKAIAELKNEFRNIPFQLPLSMNVPAELAFPLELLEYKKDVFTLKKWDRSLFDTYMNEDLYSKWQAYVSAQNALHDIYGRQLHQLTMSMYESQVEPKLSINKINKIK